MEPQQQEQEEGEQLPAVHRSIKVDREDIVAALLRLRGDPGDGTAAVATAGGKRGRGQLLPAKGANVRRRRILLRAVRKVARCCQAAGVRTAPALAATLAFFDFGPADESRQKAGRMRTVDLWHWLRLLSAPTGSGGAGAGSNHGNIHEGGQRRSKGVASHDRNNRRDSFGTRGSAAYQASDRMVSERLLDGEETSLLLDAVECRPVVGAGEEVKTSEADIGFYVSVSALWDLLLEHVPGLWDRDLQARLEAAEVRLLAFGD